MITIFRRSLMSAGPVVVYDGGRRSHQGPPSGRDLLLLVLLEENLIAERIASQRTAIESKVKVASFEAMLQVGRSKETSACASEMGAVDIY